MVDGMRTLDELEVEGKTVLLRLDINCPVAKDTKAIVNDNRIRMSVPSLLELVRRGARTVVMAHQGDPLDYQNFGSLREHAGRLAEHAGVPVDFIEDVAGPAALDRIRNLQRGQVLLLENIRLLTEETILFEEQVRLSPEAQTRTFLVRQLSSVAHAYVGDAFAAAHRSEPSLVAFPRCLPSACGRLMEREVGALSRVRDEPARPSVFVLGGAKILDAFRMMREALQRGSADLILTTGLAGQVMLRASGVRLGEASERVLADMKLLPFVEQAAELLQLHGDRIRFPEDVAVVRDGRRQEVPIRELPVNEPIVDIGTASISAYESGIGQAGTVFLNGPAGIYEEEASAEGTRRLWQVIARSSAYSVVGGGDSVAAAGRFGVRDQFSYVSTAGGGLVRFMSGEHLPVIEALQESARKFR